MATLDDKLRKRYGADRFDPSQGQNTMSFQEWLDRHPALLVRSLNGRISEEDVRAKYEAAVGPEGGAAYQEANPDWQTRSVDAPDVYTRGARRLDDEGKEIRPRFFNPFSPGNDDRLPGPDAPPFSTLPGPDKPPRRALDAARRRYAAGRRRRGSPGSRRDLARKIRGKQENKSALKIKRFL